MSSPFSDLYDFIEFMPALLHSCRIFLCHGKVAFQSQTYTAYRKPRYDGEKKWVNHFVHRKVQMPYLDEEHLGLKENLIFFNYVYSFLYVPLDHFYILYFYINSLLFFTSRK